MRRAILAVALIVVSLAGLSGCGDPGGGGDGYFALAASPAR